MKKILFLLSTVLLFSCATIIHGPNQTVSFISSPDGATVLVDNMEKCITPCTVPLKRSTTYSLQMVLNGYQNFNTNIQPSVDPLLFGNIIFGGIIGIVVDIASGSMYKFPKEYNVVFDSGILPYQVFKTK